MAFTYMYTYMQVHECMHTRKEPEVGTLGQGEMTSVDWIQTCGTGRDKAGTFWEES